MFVFQIVSSEHHADKFSFIKHITRHIGNMMYKTDVDALLIQIPAEKLGFDQSDFNVSSYGNRAYRSLQKMYLSIIWHSSIVSGGSVSSVTRFGEISPLWQKM